LITDLKIGGTPTVVRELAFRLREPGKVEIDVACLAEWGPVADQLSQGGVWVKALGAKTQRDLGVIPQLTELIRQRGYDTVFSFLIHANAAAAAAWWSVPGVRFVQSIQTTQPRPRWHWMLQRIVKRAADLIVVPSESVAKVARIRAGVPESKLVVIHNAVDTPSAPLERVPGGEAFRVGFIGRLDPIKRVNDVVRAVGMLDARFTLDIFGEGSYRSRIEQEIDLLRLNNRVRLHGQTNGPWNALAGIDLLVLPSEAEGMPLVPIEAMAARVPVVASNAPGIRDVVRDQQTGLLYEVGDIHDLAQLIRQVSINQALRERLVDAGYDDVHRRFAWDAVLKKYRAVLRIE
jgi:glycosyltransferase involved in cell wall biosynthesis